MLLPLLVACSAPPVTEVLVFAETDLVRLDPDTLPPGECSALPDGVDECEMRLVKIDVLVPGDPGSPTGLTTLVDPTFRDHVVPPLSWGIVAPDEDPTAEVEIILRGYFGGADLDPEPHLIEKRATVRFVRDEVRLLCLHLEASCVGVVCGAGQTCDAGTCESTVVDTDRLPVVPSADALPSCPSWPGIP
jgi:hypothetical protein